MRTVAVAAVLAAVFGAAVVAGHPRLHRRDDGMACLTLWTGTLALISDGAGTITPLTLTDDDDQRALITTTSDDANQSSFTFSMCNVGGRLSAHEGEQGYSYGVIQPGSHPSYDAALGCLTSLTTGEGTMHRVVVDACATNDITLAQQWFKAYSTPDNGSSSNSDKGDLPAVYFQGDGANDGYYNAAAMSFDGHDAVVVGSADKLDSMLAFSGVQRVKYTSPYIRRRAF